jgi:hypothetical protein
MFPPRAGVLVPKTQIFLLRHLPIQLGFRLRHWWSRPNYFIRKFWRFVIHPVFVFAEAKKQYWMQSLLRDAVRVHPPLTIPTEMSILFALAIAPEGGDFRNIKATLPRLGFD